MPGEIKIILGGDATRLVKASEESVSSLDRLKNAATASNAALAKTYDVSAAAESAMERLSKSIDEAAAAALAAKPRFDTLGGRLPLQEFNAFRSSIERLKADIASGVAQIQKIPPSVNPIPPALSKATSAANNASFALTNIGRVAQDLPFGFIAIQNNLNPLLESFQRLKIETGSSKAAFKALGDSLLGAGGIGLVLSVVSSAFVIAQNGIAGFNKKSKEAKESADELKKAIRSISEIQGEAAAGVQGQIVTVNALSKAIIDETKSQTERKQALEQLREVNKAYFGDLTLEAAQLATLKTRVEDYTKALIQQAVAKGFEDDIVAIKKAQVKADKELAKARLEVVSAQEQINKANQDAFSGIGGREGVANTRQQVAAQKELIAATERQRTASATTTDLKAQELVLTDQLNRSVLEGLKFKSLTTEGTKKETDALKAQIEALEKLQDLLNKANLDSTSVTEKLIPLKVRLTIRDAKKNGLSQEEVDLQVQALQKELQAAFEKQALRLESIKVQPQHVELAELPSGSVQSAVAKATGLNNQIPTLTIPAIRIKILGVEAGTAINEAIAQFDAVKQSLLDASLQGLQETADIFGQTIGGIFSGENVGNALANAAKGFLSIVGSVLQAVGRQILVTSKLVSALKAAIDKLFGPGGEIIAAGVGLALIAFGGALKNIQFNIPKLANGGIATKATLGIFGEAGKEAIIPLDRLPDLMGNVNAAQPALVLQPSIRFEGADFRIMLQEVDQRRGRLG